MSKMHTNYTKQIYIKCSVTVIVWQVKKIYIYTCEEKRKGNRPTGDRDQNEKDIPSDRQKDMSGMHGS